MSYPGPRPDPHPGPRPDPRAERTRDALRRALLEECALRPLEKLSIAAVVRRAGTGRTTFYLHYTDLADLAVDACVQDARDAVEALHAWRGVPSPDAPPAPLTEFFGKIAESRDLYRTLLGPGASGPLGDVLRRELRERSRAERELAGGKHAALVASAVAGTFASVLADWVHDEEPVAPRSIAGQVWRLLIALHRAL